MSLPSERSKHLTKTFFSHFTYVRQNCRMGGDRCPHKGCVEAKRVLLHLKTCSASNNGCSCPTAFNGCHQSRKLLHHYLKCRELRAKQAGMGRRTKTVQHVCLVCSLVARHAKNVLEGSARKSSAKKQVISSFTLSEPGPDGNGRRDSAVAMPPPPPRQPGSVPIPGWRNPSNSDSSSDDGLRCESPPSRNQLMQLSEVAAAAAPPSLLLANPAALGKSLDSSKNPFLAFAASALQNLKRASPAEEVMPEGFASPRRSRAESYDERTLKQLQNTKRPNAQVDPTWELDLKDDRTIDAPEDEAVFVRRRARSASLGMLATACLSRNGCDTIEEEESLREEEPPFDIDEDSI